MSRQTLVSPLRVAAVSFLNSRPLIEGLGGDPTLELFVDVPSRLLARLEGDAADVALVPIIDVLRADGGLSVVSDACIASDGETMTVRVFSQVRPDRVSRLAVDGDSHTSVALARVLWQEMFERPVEVAAIDARAAALENINAVLLIGDKVVDPRRTGFAFEVDLGGAWKSHTGLPFVFAVWACRTARLEDERFRRSMTAVARRLSAARDAGVARAVEIARRDGPAAGWPPALAERYLDRCLKYTLDDVLVAGAERFAAGCQALGLCPPTARIPWVDAPAGQVA